jgi:hypothetical protein
MFEATYVFMKYHWGISHVIIVKHSLTVWNSVCLDIFRMTRNENEYILKSGGTPPLMSFPRASYTRLKICSIWYKIAENIYLSDEELNLGPADHSSIV